MAFGVSSHDISSAFGKGLHGLKVEAMANTTKKGAGKGLTGRALAESVMLGVVTVTVAAIPVIVTRVPAPESLLAAMELLQDWCTPSVCFVVLIVGVMIATAGVWGSGSGSFPSPEQNHKTFTEAYLTQGPVSATQMDPLRMPDIFFSADAARAHALSHSAVFPVRVSAQPTSVVVPVYYPALIPSRPFKDSEPERFQFESSGFVQDERFVNDRFVPNRFSPRVEESFSPERFVDKRFLNPQVEEMYVPQGQEMYPEAEERYLSQGQKMYPEAEESYVPQGQEMYPKAEERYLPQGQKMYPEAEERYVPQGQKMYPEAEERYVPQGQEMYPEAEERYVHQGQEMYPEAEERYVPQGQEMYPEAEERYVPQGQEIYAQVEERYESQEQDRFEVDEDMYEPEERYDAHLEETNSRYDAQSIPTVHDDDDDDEGCQSESEDDKGHGYVPVVEDVGARESEECEFIEVEPQQVELQSDVEEEHYPHERYEDDEQSLPEVVSPPRVPETPPAPQLPPSTNAEPASRRKPPTVPTPKSTAEPVITDSPKMSVRVEHKEADRPSVLSPVERKEADRPSVLSPRTPPRHANGRRTLASSSSRSYADYVRRSSNFSSRTTPKVPAESKTEAVEAKGGSTTSTSTTATGGSALMKQMSMPARKPREVMVVDDDKLEENEELQGDNDDVDQRVEAFLKNFREQMRLQRQESLSRHRSRSVIDP